MTLKASESTDPPMRERRRRSADMLVADLQKQLPRLQKQPAAVHDAASSTGFAH